jgi:hypothetical protein
MQSKMTGPLAVFDDSMTTPVDRPVTAIQIIEETTFSVLEFMFPAETQEGVAPTSVAFPPLFMLENVKSFQIADGSALVAFRS